MCGIAGFINFQKVDKGLSKKMNTVIRHRGPDDEGYVFVSYDGSFIQAYGSDTNPMIKDSTDYISIEECDTDNTFLSLGHRRLSIIDLSKNGHQPMKMEKLVISFNGEIYNYIEIREELKQKGYQFKTESDTEVIINAYLEWDEQCVLHFNGMWAFVIWDGRKRKLFCSRDRLGVKPFYYFLDQKKGKFNFGSELKQIVQDKEIPRILNTNIMASNIVYGISNYSDETLINQIQSLLGGYNLTVQIDLDNGRIESAKLEQYWDLKIDLNADSEATIIARLGKEIERSLQYRLRSDAQVGVLLSGGLDSSSLVAVINYIRKQNSEDPQIDTFTSVYKNTIHDESAFAHLVNTEFGCTEHFIEPQIEDVELELERMVWHMEGITSLSILGFMKVLEETRNYNNKVIINGQNGDETLFGYERYYAFYFKELMKRGRFRKFIKEFNLASKNSKLRFIDLVKYMAYFNIPFIHDTYCRWRANICVNKKLFRKIDHKQIKSLLYPSNLEALEYNEIKHTQLPHILWMDDRGYMAFSLESRVPFADYEYVEMAMNIPPEMKIKQGYTKYLLRKCMEGKMSKEIIWRKNKLGFQAPTEKWADKITEEYFEKLLVGRRSGDFFSARKLRQCFQKDRNNIVLIDFILLEIFMKLFDVKVEDC